ncbi:hypothetical protein ACLMJK_005123 [Lecanora helva]
MPRDLFSSDTKDDSLVASPESQTPKPEGAPPTATSDNDSYPEITIHTDEASESTMQHRPFGRAKANDYDDLHPYVQTLSVSNLESCIALENAIFPEQERCSPEKFRYRLTVCPELCFGLFSTTTSPPSSTTIPTYATAHPPDSAYPSKRAVLIAMIIATKTNAPGVTDESMEYPPDYRTTPASASGDTRGHQEQGRTIGIHSVGVLPAYQRRGLAKTMMKSYQQRMETSGIADRIALLAHSHLVKMYEGMGFVDKGESKVKFGGGGWTDLIYEFSEHGAGMMFGS